MIYSGMGDWNRGASFCPCGANECNVFAFYPHAPCTCELDLEIMLVEFRKAHPVGAETLPGFLLTLNF